MKQVFRFLIEEAPYLIDDKASERCQTVDAKESLKIRIDSVRKSLGIEDMADVELLVDVLYRHQEKHEKLLEEEKKRMEEAELEEIDNGGGPEANPNSMNDPRKTSNEATINGNGENQASHEEEEIDENKLRLDAELLTGALKEFHQAREDRDLRKDLMN